LTKGRWGGILTGVVIRLFTTIDAGRPDVKQAERLRRRQALLKDEIAANLDFLIGSVTTKGPERSGYNLTAKVDGKTVSRYIRKALVPTVRAMTKRHNKLRALLRRLAETNWALLQLQTTQGD
jgi:hypothetical protein